MTAKKTLDLRRRPDRYAEDMKALDVPVPLVTGPALDGAHWCYRFDWEGVIVVETKERDCTDAFLRADALYRALTLLLRPRCLDGAPWGLA